jgi:hypothetical protein
MPDAAGVVVAADPVVIPPMGDAGAAGVTVASAAGVDMPLSLPIELGADATGVSPIEEPLIPPTGITGVGVVVLAVPCVVVSSLFTINHLLLQTFLD